MGLQQQQQQLQQQQIFLFFFFSSSSRCYHNKLRMMKHKTFACSCGLAVSYYYHSCSILHLLVIVVASKFFVPQEVHNKRMHRARWFNNMCIMQCLCVRLDGVVQLLVNDYYCTSCTTHHYGWLFSRHEAQHDAVRTSHNQNFTFYHSSTLESCLQVREKVSNLESLDGNSSLLLSR